MKCIVIGTKNFGKKNNPAVFAEKLNADLCYWEDLLFDIKTSDVKVFHDGKNILEEGYELALCLGWYGNGKKTHYRDIAFSLAKIFDANGIKYWNSEMGMQRPVTKLSQMVIMALNDIQVPNTLYSLDSSLVMAQLNDGEKHIVKAISASRGKSNYCLDSLSEVQNVLNSDETQFIVQEFIPNDHDLRIICFGAEPQLALKRSRTSSDTHLNNTSQGASAEWIEIPEDLKLEAAKIAKLLGRDMGGIDFIESFDKLDKSKRLCYCLEVNAIPQLTSGTDVERKMEALIKTVNGIN